MGVRSDVMTVLRGGTPERVPWTVYSIELPRGNTERKLRNNNLGIVLGQQVYEASMPNVAIETRTTWENGKQSLRRTYDTPVGKVSEKIEFSPCINNEGYESEWIVEHMVKSVSDYDIVRFIVEDLVFRNDHEGVARAQRRLGQDGIVLGRMGRSPLQRLLIKIAGFKQVALDLHDHPDVVEGLLEVMGERQDEVYEIGTESPADILWVPDNISSSLTPPPWFDRYVLPF